MFYISLFILSRLLLVSLVNSTPAYARRAPFVVQCRWHFRHFPPFRVGITPMGKARTLKF